MDPIAVTRRVIAGLPLETKQALANVTVYVRDKAPSEIDLERGAGPELRGYFWGVAPEPQSSPTQLPDDTPATGEIVIFAWKHRDELELERTIMHEIGHATGHSETELCEEMGLGS